ncbi:MAG: FMN-binding protein [Planctomycetes bacterium]|nr:FMN-binding protein [Planctomycetota bacterium]
MSGPIEPAARAATPVTQMFGTLVGVGLVCGFLIVTAFQATAPIILQNRIEARARAVLQVVPGAVESHPFRFVSAPEPHFEAAPADASDGELVFAAFAGDGALVGVAIPAEAMGYQDVVRILFGYAPGEQRVVGLQVLESRETPGLGDRVEKDPAFVGNFAALDVTLADGGEALVHPIEIVKPDPTRSKTPWQIDTISGATITSSTVARMVRDMAALWVPRIAARLEDFRPEGAR